MTSNNTKKRKISRNSARGHYPQQQEKVAASPTGADDTILPSCEADSDDAATLSFSASSSSFTLAAATSNISGGVGGSRARYPEEDRGASSASNNSSRKPSRPPRLQTHSSLVSTAADYASSTASSPCCSSALAEVCIDSDRDRDRGGDEVSASTDSGTAPPPPQPPYPSISTSTRPPLPTRSTGATAVAAAAAAARSGSPLKNPHRSIMTGEGDFQRSSSPLKRRASNLEPEPHEDDVDMVGPIQLSTSTGPEPSSVGLARAMSIDPPDGGPGYGENADGVPPVVEQLKIIQTLQAAFNERPVVEGDVAFVVSKAWVQRGLELGSDPKLARSGIPDSALGPVDNSDIILQVMEDRDGKPFVRLKPGTDLELCELFCPDAWGLIYKWYGLEDGQHPIERKAVNTQPDDTSPPNNEYEINPPVFTIHRLWSMHSGIDIPEQDRNAKPSPLLVVRSRGDSYHTFLQDIKRRLGIKRAIEIRIFEVIRALPSGPSGTADNPQDLWQSLYLEVPTWSELDYHRREKIPAPDSSMNPKFNGKSRLGTFNLGTDKTLVVEEKVGDDGWVSTKSTLASRPNRAARPANITTTSRVDSGRASPILGPVTRGRAKKKKGGRGSGAVGLHNLGNTCYMNSALQCVRSVEELTKYFLTGAYSDEVNVDNLLGYSGKMAYAYANLLTDMYHTANDSVRPSNFKGTAGSCRTTFASWGQQDSQEFLGFLLDALQEDLSRVKKKPYIEKPDSTDDMVHDEAAIARMADEVWDITMKRDKSVVSDLFTGLYKSTLKCPVCHKISITFDPFNNLTLPLPVENPWGRVVRFYPLNDRPVDIDVDIPQHSSIDALKRFISERTGVPPERLIGAEEYKCKFFKTYDDTMDVSDEITAQDCPAMHELETQPSNWPPKPVSKPKTQQKIRSMITCDESPESDDDPYDDVRYDNMVVPVLHRRDSKMLRSYSTKENGVPPHFIVLNRDEARDEDAIRRKILEKVATLTTWSRMLADEEGDTAENTDAEMTLASDADSGDSKVVAKSVESEDDMVDVSMKGVGKGSPLTTASSSRTIPSKQLKVFNMRRPAWADTKVFLEPELQNMFDLGYFYDAKNVDTELSTGWNTVDDSKPFPRLSSRAPEPVTPVDQDSPGQGSWQAGNDSDNESGSEDGSNSITQGSAQTRMVDDSEEDEDVVQHKPRGQASRNKHKNKNKNKKVGATAPAAAAAASAAGGGRGRQTKNRKTYAKKDRQRPNKGGGRRGNKHANHHQNHQSFQLPSIPSQDRMAGTMPDDTAGPLVRLGEGIVVDWNEDAWDTLFAMDMRTYKTVEKLQDPALEQKRKQRVSRRTLGISLDDCLDEFERAEILSEHDMWYCPRCKEHRRASKKFDLWKTPDILVCHLKRFSSSHYRRDKIDVKVNFPVEGLDLEERVLKKENGKDEIYDLIGVDEHYGGLGGGHYTASAKNFIDGQWYHYNDSSVSLVKDPSTQVVSSAAYLLFYRRRSEKPLGGPQSEAIFQDYAQKESDTEMAGGSGDEQEAGGSSLFGSIGTTPASRAVGTEVMQLGNGGDTSVEDDRPPPYTGPATLRASIEEEEDAAGDDEGIGMGSGHGNPSLFMGANWNFSSLNDMVEQDKVRDRQLDDYNTDSAQHDSSSDRGGDNDSLEAGDGSNYSLPDEPSKDPPEYYNEPSEPRAGDELEVPWAGIGAHSTPFEDDAVDIHVDEPKESDKDAR